MPACGLVLFGLTGAVVVWPKEVLCVSFGSTVVTTLWLEESRVVLAWYVLYAEVEKMVSWLWEAFFLFGIWVRVWSLVDVFGGAFCPTVFCLGGAVVEGFAAALVSK